MVELICIVHPSFIVHSDEHELNSKIFSLVFDDAIYCGKDEMTFFWTVMFSAFYISEP